MQRKNAIARFLFEFDAFEKVALPAALQALSLDPAFVEQSTALLQVGALLRLLERIAFACGIPETKMSELQSILSRADQLQRQHTRLTQSLLGQHPSLPEAYAGAPIMTEEARATGEPLEIVVLPREGRKILKPSVAAIQGYMNEAVNLQRELRTIATDLETLIRSRRTAISASDSAI